MYSLPRSGLTFFSLFAAACGCADGRDAADETQVQKTPAASIRRVVVIAEEGVPVTSEGDTVARAPYGYHLRVGKESQRRYRVDSLDLMESIRVGQSPDRSLSGWIDSSAAVPLPQADEFFSERIEREPTPNDYLERGAVYMALDRFFDATDDFTSALELESSSVEALTQRGNAWLWEGEPENAMADLDKAVQLDPENAIAHYRRANALSMLGASDKAIAAYSAAIRIKPDLAPAFSNRGGIHRRQGDFESAKEDFDTAIRIAPKFAEAYFNRGALAQIQRNYAAAAADYEAAIRFDDNLLRPYRNLALLLARCPEEKLRDPADAIALAKRGVALATEQQDAAVLLSTLAVSHAAAGEFEKAVEVQSSAIERASEQQAARYRKDLERYRSRKAPPLLPETLDRVTLKEGEKETYEIVTDEPTWLGVSLTKASAGASVHLHHGGQPCQATRSAWGSQLCEPEGGRLKFVVQNTGAGEVEVVVFRGSPPWGLPSP